MPNSLNFLQKSFSTPVPGVAAGQTTAGRSGTTLSQRQKDPNCVNRNLLLNQRCVYERQLPGESYITAHIVRLQSGYYDSPLVHGDRIDNVRFVAINFVFHPTDTRHRFVAARISLAVHDKTSHSHKSLPLPPQFDHPNNVKEDGDETAKKRKPRFLRHAPQLLYGSLSPETLDWTFNLAGSLGVAQGPASASINPEYGMKSSYKVYKMMKIQGSTRTLYSWYGHRHDVEDGELVWTLEENALQKSGLPREFTFVVMLTKGDDQDVVFEMDIEPVVGSWYGTYPKWWLNRIWYQPMHKEAIDLDRQIGQKFGPSTKEEGFNFASLMGNFDDFVSLPGTMYTKSEPVPPGEDGSKPSDSGGNRQLSASPEPEHPKNLNINLYWKGYQGGDLSSSSVSNATPRAVSSRPVMQPQAAPSPPDTGFSIVRPRQHRRRNSEVPHSSPPDAQATSSPRPRPVSAIYETSALDYPNRDESQHRRRTSAHTDISDDLFSDPYVTETPKTPLHASKSLRHDRSRSGLQHEFDASSSPVSSIRDQDEHESRSQRSYPSQDRSNLPQRRINQVDPVNRRHSLQSPPTPVLSTTPTHAPPLTSPRKRIHIPARHSRATSMIIPASQAYEPEYQSSAPNNRFSSMTDATTVAEESPRALSTLASFPPTSYPSYGPVRAVDTEPDMPVGRSRSPESDESFSPPRNPNLTRPMSKSPVLEDVDDIVQREISNYFKAHPEWYNSDLSFGEITKDKNNNNNNNNGSGKMRTYNIGADSGRQGLSNDPDSQSANRLKGPPMRAEGQRSLSGDGNGGFIKVNTEGVGYGGWEYLE